MKKSFLALVTALAMGLTSISLTRPATAQMNAPVITAKAIPKEEAEKKYPPANGRSYPVADRAERGTPGFFKSPYTGRLYDCRDLNHGDLILDETAKKVFVRP